MLNSHAEIDAHGFPAVEGVSISRFKAAPRSTPKRPQFISARDLCELEFEPIKYVVPGYIAEGLTLFAGKPKLGKSWFCMEIGLAVAEGGVCLGDTRCPEGDVLYLALEDNRRRLQSRIRKLWQIEAMVHAPVPDRLHLATEWPRAGEGGVEAIRDWIDEHPEARLVIVDVLAMFKATAAKGKDQTLYEADYLAIKELQALAMETGVAIVVVHHTRKSGAEADPFEKVSGTLGLSGAADTTLILDRDQNGCTLYGRGRDIEEIETAVQFDKPTCKWRALGAAQEVRRTDERAVILETLADNREAMSPSELADARGLPRNNVKQLLFKMAKAGEVVKAGKKGLYVHPDHAGYSDEPASPDNPDNPITDASQTVESAEEEPVIAVTEVIEVEDPPTDNPAEATRDIAGEFLARARTIQPTRGEGKGRTLTPDGEALFRDALAAGLSPSTIACLCQISRQSADYRAKKIRGAANA